MLPQMAPGYPHFPWGFPTNDGGTILNDRVNGFYLGSGFGGPFSYAATSATNRAYQRLRSRLLTDETASLGETFGEARSALSMITDRAESLTRGFSHLVTGNFRGFLRHYGLKAKRKHRRKVWAAPVEASSLWLEYWMGWAPLVSDIYNACQVLSDPFPRGRRQTLRASATLPVSDYVKFYSSADGLAYARMSGTMRVAMGAVFEVENFNLHLATRLGLINPASVAWALVPFSFLVDWVANVGDILNSYTDFAGVKVTKAWTVKHASCDYRVTDSVLRPPMPGWKAVTATSEIQAYRMERSTGLTLPSIQLTKLDGLSPTRGATAISLLLQTFSQRL